jgi:hypothetical protein
MLMELASNLAWAFAAVILFGLTFAGVRSGKIRLSMRSAMILAAACCFIMLPVISMSDDLLEARQAGLPVSGQTWRIESEPVSAGLNSLLAVGLFLLFLISFLVEERTATDDQRDVRPLAGRLARCQRLRPPPSAA